MTLPVVDRNETLRGTTVVMTVDAAGMVVGADGLAQQYQNSRPGEVALIPAQGPKSVMYGKSTVCAAAGLIAERRGHFRFDEWAREVSKTAAKRGDETEMKSIAHALFSTSPKAFASAERDFSEGQSQWAENTTFVTDMLVGGYDKGQLEIYAVSIELDRENKSFKYLEPKELYPGNDRRLPRTLTAGENSEIFKTLGDRLQPQVTKYLAYQKQWNHLGVRIAETGLRQTAIEVAALIELEHEHVPEKVGKIATLITMTPAGTAEVLEGLDK
jgi:hypothetical protein